MRFMKKNLAIAAQAAEELRLDLNITDVVLHVLEVIAVAERIDQDFPVLFEWIQERNGE